MSTRTVVLNLAGRRLARIRKHSGCSSFTVLIFRISLVVVVAFAHADYLRTIFLVILCEKLSQVAFLLLIASHEDLFIVIMGS